VADHKQKFERNSAHPAVLNPLKIRVIGSIGFAQVASLACAFYMILCSFRVSYFGLFLHIDCSASPDIFYLMALFGWIWDR